jgi:transcriptional regulator with XRE-family HTH domain
MLKKHDRSSALIQNPLKMAYAPNRALCMPFADRLKEIRKDRGLTQKALADKIQLSVLKIRKYESDKSQPTLDVIKRLAVTLGTSADQLIFDHSEREKPDDIRREVEALTYFTEDERKMLKRSS